jgi:hypothetical protein
MLVSRSPYPHPAAHGGPPRVSPPTQKGFGTAVLEQVMAEYFDAPPWIEFANAGVCYEIVGSLDSVSELHPADKD